jgi:hypothetical protein
MEALRKRQEEIRFIQVRHEEAVALTACAYAKFTGKLGVLDAHVRPILEAVVVEASQHLRRTMRGEFGLARSGVMAGFLMRAQFVLTASTGDGNS